MWWGIFCIALSVPYGLIAIVAPVTITILLVFFTGVPMLERVFKDNPEYQEYKKHTSMLIPWFVK
jgi:steroid 5-alpha reductase family enzyme